MAKDPETVKKFLADMSVKLQPIWIAEKDEMLKLKEEEVSNSGRVLRERFKMVTHNYNFSIPFFSAKNMVSTLTANWTSGTSVTT